MNLVKSREYVKILKLAATESEERVDDALDGRILLEPLDCRLHELAQLLGVRRCQPQPHEALPALFIPPRDLHLLARMHFGGDGHGVADVADLPLPVNQQARTRGGLEPYGFGVCLGAEKAEEFDEAAVEEHLENLKDKEDDRKQACGCPSSQIQSFMATSCESANQPAAIAGSIGITVETGVVSDGLVMSLLPRVNDDGTIDKYEGTDSGSGTVITITQIDALTDWIIPNSKASSGYQFRLDVTAEAPNYLSDSTGVWIAMGSGSQSANYLQWLR